MAVLSQIGVDCQLKVGMVERVDLLERDRELGWIGSEVLPDLVQEGARLSGG